MLLSKLVFASLIPILILLAVFAKPAPKPDADSQHEKQDKVPINPDDVQKPLPQFQEAKNDQLTYKSEIYGYELHYPKTWEAPSPKKTVAYFKAGNGFGLAVNVGCLAHDPPYFDIKQTEVIDTTFNNIPATKRIYRKTKEPGKGFIGYIEISFRQNNYLYCIELEPSVPNNAKDIEQYEQVISTFRFI